MLAIVTRVHKGDIQGQTIPDTLLPEILPYMLLFLDALDTCYHRNVVCWCTLHHGHSHCQLQWIVNCITGFHGKQKYIAGQVMNL